jgi:hypothetical protein
MGISPSAFLIPLLISMVGGPITPVAHPRGAAVHEIELTAAQQERIVRYWTLDRMTHAAPPVRAGSGNRAFMAGPVGRRDLAAPSASSGGALWTGRGRIEATTGKVFFSLAGRDFVCSAGTVASANRDLVVTAGHCVKDGTGAWATNWIFVPGYRDGVSPYGGFTARRMYVPGKWSSAGSDDDDFAMVALATAAGQHVTDVAGSQSIGFGRRRGREAYAFGYPATGAYDGERLAYCSGRTHADPHRLSTGQGLRCDMTQGSSGGVWLSGFDPATGTGIVTSVSSFKYADDSDTMYGPYFGDTARALYQEAGRG